VQEIAGGGCQASPSGRTASPWSLPRLPANTYHLPNTRLRIVDAAAQRVICEPEFGIMAATDILISAQAGPIDEYELLVRFENGVCCTKPSRRSHAWKGTKSLDRLVDDRAQLVRFLLDGTLRTVQ
jgi:hypothetical protein